MALFLDGAVEELDAFGEVAGVFGVCSVAALFVDEGEAEVHDEVDGCDDEHSEVEQVENIFG